MQAMLTTLPELNLFKADAKTAPKARQWHFALLKLLLQLQEFTFKDTAAEMRLDCFETHAPIWLSRGRL